MAKVEEGNVCICLEGFACVCVRVRVAIIETISAYFVFTVRQFVRKRPF